MTNPDDQAFPDVGKAPSGLTKREYFAAVILAGICANGDISTAGSQKGLTSAQIQECFAKSAVAQADWLMVELNRKAP